MENTSSNQSSKFAFFYALSLVALAFMAVSTGIIIFQIINKNIIDTLATFQTCYSIQALRFAISAIIISAPIYYVLAWQIHKSLFSGILDKEASERKKLTYVILFISSLIIIGYLIGIIYNFLDGELTVKFILKALTALIISSAVLSYYIYDIRRKEVNKKDNTIKIYFWASLAVVIITLISGFVFVESPGVTRAKRQDIKLLENLSTVNYAIEEFYRVNNKLPKDFEELEKESRATTQNLNELAEESKFIYEFEGENKYRLCATFLTSNKRQDCFDSYWTEEWEHEKGYQCFKKEVAKSAPTEKISAPVAPVK